MRQTIGGLNGRRGRAGLSLRKTPNEAAMPKYIANIQSAEQLRGERAAKISPLMLCDHLIQVAQEADQAGYVQTAAHLVALVDRLFDAAPQRH